MVVKYAFLLASCAVLLLVGCGSDNSVTDIKSPETQQEMQKDTTSDTTKNDQTESKGAGVEKAMPEENVDKGMTQEEMEQDCADSKETGSGAIRGDETKDNTTPDGDSSDEPKSSNQDLPVTGVLNT